jgi:SulP family sulfate permease
MPSSVIDGRNFQSYLAEMDLLKEHDGVMISETLDGALEWIEEQILTQAGRQTVEPERRLDLPEFPLCQGFEAKILAQLAGCMRELSVAPGESIIKPGEAGDELFLVRRGSVRILQPLEGGQHHHLATIGQGDFFGELCFLDHGVRMSAAVAKSATDLYVLSRAHLDAQAGVIDPSVSTLLFSHLAFAIAERLRQTDSDLQKLEER